MPRAPTNKIVKLSDLRSSSVADSVLCYGHFNVIHPGHLRFLQYAKSLGSHLTVAITHERHIPESDKKHYFPQQERAEGVAALHFVDKVILLGDAELQDVITRTKPKVLVLGKEFEKNKRFDLKPAMDLIEASGGKIVYHAGEVHYATADLLYSSSQEIEDERQMLFQQTCKRQSLDSKKLLQRIDQFKNARILVVGDTIVDQYVACDAVGMSAEAPVLVVKEIEAREFVGGAGVVAAHVTNLGAQCSFLSVVGQDSNAQLVRDNLEAQGVKAHLLEDASRPTTFKIRYMVDNQKLFRVSRLKEHSLGKEVEDQLIERLKQLAPEVDGILVCDFVYGVVTPRLVEEIGKIAQTHGVRLFGDVQCSTQVGSVAKFENYHLLCPTEREARIALGNQDDGLEWIATKLLTQTKSKNLIVKLGAEGFIAYNREAGDDYINREHFPALVSNPVDVAGAGDSLLAAVAVSMCSGGDLMESSAIGTCMAALAVQTIGNIPVPRQKLMNYIRELENL